MMILWPFSKRRRRVALLDADAQVAQAAQDRRRAEAALEDARRLAEWAREATASNRFALRLDAAYRTRLSRGGP